MSGLGGTSQRGYVSLPWGQVHYRESGKSSDPAVILLHQSPLSSATYEPILPILAQSGIHAIAFDTPGYGLSDPPPKEWSISDYAMAAWEVVDRLGVGKPIFLGQHTGAVIATEAVHQRRSHVTGLVLQGLPIYSDLERQEKLKGWAPGYKRKTDGSHLRVIWERIRTLYPDLDDASTDRQIMEYLSIGPDYGPAYRAVFKHHLNLTEVQQVPTLLLQGNRDLVARMTDKIRSSIPNANFKEIEGTDFVHEEQPALFSQELTEFIYETQKVSEEIRS